MLYCLRDRLLYKVSMSKSRVTIADVAKRAQVSHMSVSRVLNGKFGVIEENRERILKATKNWVMLPIRWPAVCAVPPRLLG
jgi:hypothetical protein